jgi:hypothetical protein
MFIILRWSEWDRRSKIEDGRSKMEVGGRRSNRKSKIEKCPLNGDAVNGGGASV